LTYSEILTFLFKLIYTEVRKKKKQTEFLLHRTIHSLFAYRLVSFGILLFLWHKHVPDVCEKTLLISLIKPIHFIAYFFISVLKNQIANANYMSQNSNPSKKAHTNLFLLIYCKNVPCRGLILLPKFRILV